MRGTEKLIARKGAQQAEKIAEKKGIESSKKSASFVVTPDGVAVPLDQKVMREGFDNAVFKSQPSPKTKENGIIQFLLSIIIT